ncbi:tRNA (adenosine(37)-N6)-threonylcarbamoyltransferase complex dimerization subunit type 1 TsaB [Pseudodesulfovibrio sp. JC047]|uniref:tRNA (adenosine(37)-N6)-threonylcarbamoyltransferase complex dimerization subunit type 1 TsaB n=1 Tax=Pseudodesulfovibrio sp. JC047 TaxID=2683199 RepID=UPI0013D4F528|nr:tRNA (adenosine(37)-N6)-threonylcarbamoyltransferase complex dimerization subunit type 1 TsaB [Pseudodesulfovibrio sp. JC047]NDV17886.1 tRNA (adenosine(37)-N6)-threonylcarbamoyltransferase complex dimerization subunit type 1 TsaB [Pseudodesulfovibrio sp. JC047]
MAAPKRIQPHDLLLAIGGSEERLQMVLGQPGPDGCTLLVSRQWTVPGQSIKFLIPGLQQTLASFDIGMETISRIACVRGPGSFTGLRLILAAAEGLAAGYGLPLAGLDYLPLLASGPAPLLTGPIHVLTYARRGLVYTQSFEAPGLTELAPLESCSLPEAAKRIQELGDTAFIMGSGVKKNPEFFADLIASCPGYTLLDRHWDNPTPETLLTCADTAFFSQESIDPVYVRPTDAEDNLEAIARKRGLDPVETKKKLEALRKK